MSALHWRIHTPSLLSEISKGSGQAIYAIPLNMFGKLLAEVGERASELNDPELNALMMRLTIYTEADPCLPGYDQKFYEQVIRRGKKAKLEKQKQKK